ncbi:uncharacterized protein LOC126409721 [Nymphaea colorata]|uniref:uncharacterized protein LOC126409721 n=1 Tax=Nymphaea colorata TaxID=210225 RepID=UPI00214E9D2B|nr:uncharacterized protein LOC126409721 [Nymphaea colorata]
MTDIEGLLFDGYPYRVWGCCFHVHINGYRESGSMGSTKNKDSKMSDMNAKMKTAAIVSMEKAKAAAVFGAQKVKSGTTFGIKWVKTQYQKRTSK